MCVLIEVLLREVFFIVILVWCHLVIYVEVKGLSRIGQIGFRVIKQTTGNYGSPQVM